MKRWLISATAASTLALIGASASAGSLFTFYQEQGDAGGSFANAQSINGGTFGGIFGDIGGCVGSGCGSGIGLSELDGHDFYLFGWQGGAFGIQLTVSCPVDQACDQDVGGVGATLYDADQTQLLHVSDGDGIVFVPGDDGNAILAQGNYYLQIAAGFDPPFTLETFTLNPRFTEPVVGPITGPDQVPEPASMAILGLGLAGLGLSMRRRRRGAI